VDPCADHDRCRWPDLAWMPDGDGDGDGDGMGRARHRNCMMDVFEQEIVAKIWPTRASLTPDLDLDQFRDPVRPHCQDLGNSSSLQRKGVSIIDSSPDDITLIRSVHMYRIIITTEEDC
jgi:hypothetical protein